MANMTSRETVRRCIEFDDPPRIARHFAVAGGQGKSWPITDFAYVAYGPDPDSGLGAGLDEWGIHRETLDETGANFGQVKEHPIGEGWQALENYSVPDFSKPGRYTDMQPLAKEKRAEGLYTYGSIPSLMTLPGELRGMENWFMDHALHEQELCQLLDAIMNARLQLIAAYHEAGMQAVITWDDMGTHERPMVSPEMFRTIYFPLYKATCDELHNRGMHFIHHCCGQVAPYMDMFLEAGCDVLQLDQPTLMGIDWLGENYGGNVCFWNPVDIQRTIGRNDLDAIEDEAHHQVWTLGNYGGGFMIKAYEQPDAIAMTEQEADAQRRAFMQYSDYPLQPYA